MSEKRTTGALILVVEDNATNARLAGSMLEAAGYRVATAADGEAGLRQCLALHPAVVVTDLQMPGMDGLTLLRHLKANTETRDIPVIVLTAHVMHEHRDQAFLAGCASFISKPVRYQSFTAEIEHVLRDSYTGACLES